MSLFNVLKGAYPTLQQIDKALLVKSGTVGIVRGSCIFETTGGVFDIATAAQASDPTAYIYFSLQDQNDLTAGMAGNIGMGYKVSGGQAKINGLASGMPFEFETTEFVAASYTIGQLLTVANGGKLTAHSSGNNCVAQVTKAVASKYANDAVAVTGYRTGANVNVLTARTMFVPKLVTA